VDEREVRKSATAVGWREVSVGTGARSQVLLGPDDGMPHFAMRRFQMDVGGGMPLHTNTVEHEQYVLRGRARIRIGDRVHEVGPEDVLSIPAGMPHAYEVVEGPFAFLCMVPNLPDRIDILEKGR
jgi:quercetin dioxygenase-like cupin family protein